ncbi:MAG: spinster family MFS transporter [Novosphingobium sp.]
MQQTHGEQGGPSAARQGGAYAWYALGILIIAYTFSYLDRQALTLLVGPIRKSLDISDTQLSLLHGFAFAIFYTVLGLPLGRLVDQHRRTTIIAAGVGVWSIMTALCGLAKNFTHMFLARVGVGVGEASLSPGAYSLISDYFPPRTRPVALSLYLSAIYVGSGLATIIGGTIIAIMPAMELPVVGHLEPWQGVFIAIGLPGVLVALWVMTMREPARTGKKADMVATIGATMRYMADNGRTYSVMIMGYALLTLMWNCAIAWYPTLFMRVHGWSTTEVGTRFGLVIMVSGALGVLCGGILATRLRDHGLKDSNILVGIVAGLIALPAGLASGLLQDAWPILAAVFVFQFGCAMPFGAAAAALQDITPNQMRGQVTAIYQFTTNMFGIGLGPTLTALFTDHLFRDEMALGSSLALSIGISGPVALVLLWIARGTYKRTLASVDF